MMRRETVIPISDKIQHPKKKAFIAAYRKIGVISRACAEARVNRSTYYEWSEHDTDFATACGIAIAEFGDRLVEKCNRLGLEQDNVPLLIVALKMAGRFVEYTPPPAPPPRIYEREVAGDRVTAN